MDDVLARMRQEYGERGLRRADVLADPLEQFTRWFDEACSAPILEPNAMTLATVDAAGQPSARTVLLKAVDRRGLTLYTNLESRKARELAANPKAALLFWWPPQARQVRFEGEIETVDAAAADAYFATPMVSAGGTDQAAHALRNHPRSFEVATRPTPGSGHDGPQREAHLACHGSTGGE